VAAKVIDGKAVAAGVRERVAADVRELGSEIGRPPGLATVLVGDDPASAISSCRCPRASTPPR
jgi:methylenetetrahydrofolate dehydrogenase (NADP+) / methenyltetrahydrofolate cyclohydrolase